MADEIVSGADSAPVTEAAPSAAAEETDATHGAETTETTTTETDAADTTDADLDDDEDSPPENQTDEEKTRAQKRRERRQAREEQRIQERVDAALAKRESEQQAKATAEAQQKAIREAAEAEARELAEFLGTPETIAQLQTEIAETNRKIRAELTNPTGADLDELDRQAARAEADLARFQANGQYRDRIAKLLWGQIEGGFVHQTTWPELSSPEAKQAYLGAQGGIPGAFEALAGIFRADKAAALKAQASKHADEIKALESDRNAWRTRAGGTEVAEHSTGAPANGSGLFTRERLATMTTAEYRQHRAEIERQAAAGLIR